MDFFEAMAKMKDGAKVRLKSWDEDQYIGIKEEEIKTFGKLRTKYSAIYGDETEVSPCMPFSVLIQAQWEEVL